MKIKSFTDLSEYTNGKVHNVLEWKEAKETCDMYTLPFRVRENEKIDGWLRNLRVSPSEEKLDAYKRPYQLYSLIYEKKNEYSVAEISDTQAELIKFLELFPGHYAIFCRNGELWLDATE